MSYFKPNFIENIFWKSGFSNFGHVTKREMDISILVAILTWWMFLIFFIWFKVYTDMVQVSC